MCTICKREIRDINKRINGEYSYFLEKIFINYPKLTDLKYSILEYLFDYDDKIIVYSERKRRRTDNDINENSSDSDDYFIYSTLETPMCKPCFLFSVNEYYVNNKRLPYLRRDIFCFNCNNINETENFYKKNYMNYEIPDTYNIYYYREEDYIYNNNKRIITKT